MPRPPAGPCLETVSIDDVDPRPADEAYQSDRRPLSDALSTTDLAITRYALEPGERFSGSVHAHRDQEEVFVVLEGEATFETRDGGTAVVGADEVIRFAPGEFQSGWNDADRRLVALGLGAPRDSADVRIARIPALDDRDVSCPDCGREAMRLSPGDGGDLVCPDCGARLDPQR